VTNGHDIHFKLVRYILIITGICIFWGLRSEIVVRVTENLD